MHNAIHKFIDEQCTGEIQTLNANGIDYSVYTMNDGWLAVFKNNHGNLTPVIQSADMTHVLDWIGVTETTNFKIDKLVEEDKKATLEEIYNIN